VRDRFPFLLVGGLLLLGFVGITLMRAASRGEFADRLSTYRSEEQGARALYLLAEESGLPVARSRADLEVIEGDASLVLLGTDVSSGVAGAEPEPLEELSPKLLPLPSADGGTAFKDDGEQDDELMNEIRASDVSPDEREKLLEHVKAGHTLIHAPWKVTPNPLLDAAGVSLRAAKTDADLKLRTLVPAQPTPYTLGVERVEAEVRSFLDLSPDTAVPVLVDDVTGEVVASVSTYGQGRIVVLGAPELAMNRALARADNAQLWLSLLAAAAGKDRLLFDEFHHGFAGDRSVAAFASRYGLHLAIGQLVLGLCLWALALRRFGRPREPEGEDRTAAVEALSAAGRLYRAGKHRAFAAGLIASGLSQELASPAGLPPRAAPGDVGARLRERGRPDLAAALEEVLKLSRSADSDEGVELVARTAARARGLLRRRRPPEALSAASRISVERPAKPASPPSAQARRQR
jgi:hypothetical protein